MFGLFSKKEQKGSISTFLIDGMHCVSCSMNVDDTLEEMNGVLSAKTSYAKGETVVSWDPALTNENAVMKTIKDLGYIPKLKE